MFKKFSIGKILTYIFLLIGGITSIFPFYWLAVTATRTSAEFMRFPPTLLPGKTLLINLTELFSSINFLQSFANTVFVAVVTTIFVVFFCSLAGFTFAKFNFPGKKWLFALLLATMMIPTQISLIPNFILMSKFGWVNEFKAIIIPSLISAFGIFWIKQFCESAIHDDLLNSGRIDGCTDFQLFSKIGFQIVIPATTFLGLFTFMNAWNNYLWPMVVISDSRKNILQVTLAQLKGVHKDTNLAMVMSGTLLATIPLVVVFIIFSKKFISGVAAGAIKG